MDLNDVDLGGDDENQIDRLVDRTEFGRDEAEAIVRFAKLPHDCREPDNIRSFVSDGNPDNGHFYTEDGLTPDECDSIRRDMGKSSRPTTVIDAWPGKHPSVIFRHATGRCEHDGDVDPVTSPRIEADECREMRVDFQTGDTVEDIRTTYNRSANAVVKHVFGRCPHSFNHDRAGRELSDAICRRMRRAYRENDTATIDDVASAFIVGTSTAHRHLTGDCRHRDDVEGPVGSNGAEPIDEDECERMRDAYGRGDDADAIADAVGRDATAVRKHAFGRCRHGESPFSPEHAAVGPKLCKAIRHEYRTRGVKSVASVIDRLQTSKGTFNYHLWGRCDHDHDVDPVGRSGSEV